MDKLNVLATPYAVIDPKVMTRLCQMLQASVDILMPLANKRQRKQVIDAIGTISAVKTILETYQPAAGHVIPLRKAA